MLGLDGFQIWMSQVVYLLTSITSTADVGARSPEMGDKLQPQWPVSSLQNDLRILTCHLLSM